MKNLHMLIPITKVDAEKRLVYGIATAEQVDKSGEICDYETTKPEYQKWSAEIEKASGGKSLGNLRAMHDNIAAGKVTQIFYHDAEKQIEICAKVVDDDCWNKVLEGVFTAFSQGGKYVKTWKDPVNKEHTRYTAEPSEISLVDNPCLGSATFEVIKADGQHEMRKFKTVEPEVKTVDENGKPIRPKFEPLQLNKWVASDGKTFDKKDECRAHQLTLEAKGTVSPDNASNPTLVALQNLNKILDEKEGKTVVDEPKKADDEKEDLTKGSKVILPWQKLTDMVKSLGEKIKALGKGGEIWDAKQALEALMIIDCLICGEEWEALYEGNDESSQLADLKEIITRLKSFIAAEIMEGTTDMEMLDEVRMKKISDLFLKYKIDLLPEELAVIKVGARNSKADQTQLKKAKGALDDAKDAHDDATSNHGKVGKAHTGMRDALGKMCKLFKAMNLGDVIKNVADDSSSDLLPVKKAISENLTKADEAMAEMEDHLDKADKHHGKVTKSHDAMAAAHDAVGHALKAVGADAEDAKDGADDEGTEKAVKAAMKKMQDESDVKMTALQTENTELKSTLEKANASIETISERIKKLEAQPMPGKGAVFTPVKKGHETQGEPDSASDETSGSLTRGASPEEARRITGIA